MEPVQLEMLKQHPAVRQADQDVLKKHKFFGQIGCIKTSCLSGATAISLNLTGQQYRNMYEPVRSTVFYSISTNSMLNRKLEALYGQVADLVLVQGPEGPHYWAPVRVGPLDHQRTCVSLVLMAGTDKALLQP